VRADDLGNFKTLVLALREHPFRFVGKAALSALRSAGRAVIMASRRRKRDGSKKVAGELPDQHRRGVGHKRTDCRAKNMIEGRPPALRGCRDRGVARKRRVNWADRVNWLR
jgi:hypothetical protein